MEGLIFPKQPAKKKRMRHPKSILQTTKNICYICGKYGYTEVHHIFEGTAGRKLSEQYGLKVHLCPGCHRTSGDAVHRSAETADRLHCAGQQAFEAKYGSRQQFREIFGKNYI